MNSPLETAQVSLAETLAEYISEATTPQQLTLAAAALNQVRDVNRTPLVEMLMIRRAQLVLAKLGEGK